MTLFLLRQTSARFLIEYHTRSNIPGVSLMSRQPLTMRDRISLTLSTGLEYTKHLKYPETNAEDSNRGTWEAKVLVSHSQYTYCEKLCVTTLEL